MADYLFRRLGEDRSWSQNGHKTGGQLCNVKLLKNDSDKLVGGSTSSPATIILTRINTDRNEPNFKLDKNRTRFSGAGGSPAWTQTGQNSGNSGHCGNCGYLRMSQIPCKLLLAAKHGIPKIVQLRPWPPCFQAAEPQANRVPLRSKKIQGRVGVCLKTFRCARILEPIRNVAPEAGEQPNNSRSTKYRPEPCSGS